MREHRLLQRPKRPSQNGVVTLVPMEILDFSCNSGEVEYPVLRECARSEFNYGFV